MSELSSDAKPLSAETAALHKAGRLPWGAFLPVVLVAVCAELGISILNNSVLPVYLTDGLQISKKLFQFILIPFLVSEALFKFPLGALTDRLGRKPLIMFGLMMTIFTPLLLISIHYDRNAPTAAAALIGFGFLRLLDGAGQAAFWPALYAYVGDIVEESSRAAAMGVLQIMSLIGLAFGFLAGGFVDDTFGPILTGNVTFATQMLVMRQRVGENFHKLGQTVHDVLHHHSGGAHLVRVTVLKEVPQVYLPAHYLPSFYLASALFAIGALIAVLTLKRVSARGGQSALDNAEKISWAGFVSALRAVPQFLALAFVTFFGIVNIALITKLFVMDEFQISEKGVGLLILGPLAVVGILAIPIGLLADRVGKTLVLRIGFVLAAVGLWGVVGLYESHVGKEQGFIVAIAVMGLGFVMAFPSWLAILTSLADDARRGTIFGAVSAAQGVGGLTGGVVGGLLYGGVSHIAPFILSACLETLGAIMALIFVRERVIHKLVKS